MKAGKKIRIEQFFLGELFEWGRYFSLAEFSLFYFIGHRCLRKAFINYCEAQDENSYDSELHFGSLDLMKDFHFPNKWQKWSRNGASGTPCHEDPS